MNKIPELKQILGAMIFASKRPLTIREMRRCVVEVAEEHGNEIKIFTEVKNSDIKNALAELIKGLETDHVGFNIKEVAGGYRLQSDADCSVWLKHMLSIDKPQRLSRPALETLAIIAYRQPVARSEIEGVRGVAVGHMIKTLMEMQLVKIVGRSDLPGRPLLYGTSHSFLEHFGLKDLKELNQIEPMLVSTDLGKKQKKKKDTDNNGEELNLENKETVEEVVEEVIIKPKKLEVPDIPEKQEDEPSETPDTPDTTDQSDTSNPKTEEETPDKQ